MGDVSLVKSKYTGSDVTSLGELASADNAKIPGTIEVTGHTKFEGVTSTGATGTGKIVYDTGGTTTNQTLVTPALGTPASGTLDKCTHKDMIKGDGTAGRVLRAATIYIMDGTDANTIKCTTVTSWNGDANASEDNLGKPATGTAFDLSADGKTLTWKNAGISGVCVGIVGHTIVINTCGTQVNTYVTKTVDGINIDLRHITTGEQYDLTSVVGTGYVRLLITYITTE